MSSYAILAATVLGGTLVAVLAARRRRLGADAALVGSWCTLMAAIGAGLFAFIAVFRGETLGGWLLLAHTLLAPLLVLAMTLEALFRPLGRGWCRAGADALLMSLGAAAIGSMLFQMFPWFGEEGQELLLQAHRYSSLALLAALGLRAGGVWPRETPSSGEKS